MKIYIQAASASLGAHLVQAEHAPGGYEYRVHHPEVGYSVWPADQFEAQHRPLSRREAHLVNHSVAELEVMAISDNVMALV
jgi:hypothetical protein